MTPDLRHPYGLRTWIRQRLPWWMINLGIADKGADCEARGAAHYWYKVDGENRACYYCRVERTYEVGE